MSLLRDTNIVSSLPLMMINNNDFPLPSIRDRREVGAEGILKENYIIMLFHPTLLPKPSLGSSCRSLSPPGGAPGLAVHWRQLLYLRLLLATWAVAGLLPGSGRAAQAVLPTHRPPSAASKSYRQPVMTGRQEVRSVHFGHFWQ